MSSFEFDFNIDADDISTSDYQFPYLGSSASPLAPASYSDGSNAIYTGRLHGDFPQDIEDLFMKFHGANDLGDQVDSPQQGHTSEYNGINLPPMQDSKFDDVIPAALPLGLDSRQLQRRREQPVRSCQLGSNSSSGRPTVVVPSAPTSQPVHTNKWQKGLVQTPKVSSMKRASTKSALPVPVRFNKPYGTRKTVNAKKEPPPLKVLTVRCYYDHCKEWITGTHEDFRMHLQAVHKTSRHKECRWGDPTPKAGVVRECGIHCKYSNTLTRHVIDKHVQVYNTTCTKCKKTFRFDKFTNDRHLCIQ